METAISYIDGLTLSKRLSNLLENSVFLYSSPLVFVTSAKVSNIPEAKNTPLLVQNEKRMLVRIAPFSLSPHHNSQATGDF